MKIKSWKVILGRRERLLKYFRAIPGKMIDLGQFGFDKLEKSGVQANASCECGSVGCVAGWAQTSPEFRAWARRNGIPLLLNSDSMLATNKKVIALNRFLGINVSYNEKNSSLGNTFDSAQTNLPAKREALSRLRTLVKEAKAQVRNSLHG